MKDFDNGFKVRFSVLVLRLLIRLLNHTYTAMTAELPPGDKAVVIAAENFIKDVTDQ